MEYLTEAYGIRTLGWRGCAYQEALKRYAEKLLCSELDAELKFIRTEDGLRLYEAFRSERLAESERGPFPYSDPIG